MPDPSHIARQQAWSRYWASGQLSSCSGSFKGNYTGAILEFWRSVVAASPESERVLDVATGNGALPQLYAEARGAAEGWSIDAVDLAQQLVPAWAQAHASRIRFHPGVAAERLPFADGAFDLVVSQFGIEYANADEALGECVRVLSPGGRLAFVVHHPESVVVRVGQAELGNQELLLSETGLLAAAQDVVPWLAQARQGRDLSGNAQAGECRRRYNEALQALGQRAASSLAPDLLVDAREHVHALVAAVGPDAQPALARLREFGLLLQEAQVRTAEMIEHAVSPAGLDAWSQRLRAQRSTLRLEVRELRQAEGIVGWGLLAH
jgi:ubiquinone/menaquinone biosynthesis C-methylase UbiE